MTDPITGLAIETWKQVLDITKPWQKIFLDYIVLNYLWGKKMLISNERTKAEVENAYELKKLEWKITQQQIIQALQENDSQLEYNNTVWTLQKTLPKINENAEWNIDSDKIKRLKDLSKDFSSEEMQEVISWILAWEYNQSWSFSLKTMDIVRSLSRDELNLFKRFCWLVIDGEFILRDFYWAWHRNLPILTLKWIWYNEYLYLQELGLTSWSASVSDYEIGVYEFPIWWGILTLLLDKKITLSKSFLTKAWKELFQLIEPTFDDELVNLTKEELIRLWFKEIK
jgi:hypothetical protein